MLVASGSQKSLVESLMHKGSTVLYVLTLVMSLGTDDTLHSFVPANAGMRGEEVDNEASTENLDWGQGSLVSCDQVT
jgi:hypothetical protein